MAIALGVVLVLIAYHISIFNFETVDEDIYLRQKCEVDNYPFYVSICNQIKY